MPHEFNPDDEQITAYLEWFKLFVSVNNIPVDKDASAHAWFKALLSFSWTSHTGEARKCKSGAANRDSH